MELYQLRYFVAAAESGNFTAAARLVNISQPSLSLQIKSLEDELGQRLFDRLGRKAQLTAAGRVFLDRARRILQEVDDATRAVHDGGGTGLVRFGVIPSVAPYLLPELMPRLHQELPSVGFEVMEDFRSQLIDLVLTGKLDAAMLTMPPEQEKLEITPLLVEPLLVVMPREHRLAEKTRLRSADLEGERLVLLGDSSSLALQTRRFFGDQKVGFEISCRCAQVKTVKSLVAAGLGLAILPKMAAGRDGIPGLVYRELADPGPHREIVFVRHRQRFHGRAEETFRSILQSLCVERYGVAERLREGGGGSLVPGVGLILPRSHE